MEREVERTNILPAILPSHTLCLFVVLEMYIHEKYMKNSELIESPIVIRSKSPNLFSSI